MTQAANLSATSPVEIAMIEKTINGQSITYFETRTHHFRARPIGEGAYIIRAYDLRREPVVLGDAIVPDRTAMLRHVYKMAKGA